MLTFSLVLLSEGDRGSTVVKVLCYKSEGRWFDPCLRAGVGVSRISSQY